MIVYRHFQDLIKIRNSLEIRFVESVSTPAFYPPKCRGE
jgi:hypothetical protein